MGDWLMNSFHDILQINPYIILQGFSTKPALECVLVCDLVFTPSVKK